VAVKINKAACKRLAAEARSELGLRPMQPLNPAELAELYGISVFALKDLPVRSEVRQYFSLTRIEVFSGALVPVGSGVVIIENDSHDPARRRSTMGHELAHVLCEHQFSASLVNERGCRVVDSLQESEAAEVGGELLIPFEAAKTLARRGATDEDVAKQFGVSLAFARWRMDATGARIIARRQAAAYGRLRRA